MREFFLTSDTKINWQIVLIIAFSSSIIYVAMSFETFKEFFDREFVASNLITYLAFTFLTPILWAYGLYIVNPADKFKDIVIPVAFIIGSRALYLIYNIASHGIMGIETKTLIFEVVKIIVLPLALVAIAETQYQKTQDKLLLFFGAIFISAILSSLVMLIQYDALKSNITDNVVRILIHVTLEYYMAILLFRLYKIEVPKKEDYYLQENVKLVNFLEIEIENEASTSKTLNKAHQEFPSVTFNEIATTYTKTTKLENKRYYKTANTIIIIINVLSLLYAVSFSRNSGLRIRFDEYFSIEDLGWSLLYIAIFLFAILKLKIVADMAAFKAYTYKVMAIIGSVSLLFGIYELFSGHNPVIGFISLFLNIIIIAYCIDMSRKLYPHYKLFGARYDQRDFDINNSSDQNNLTGHT